MIIEIDYDGIKKLSKEEKLIKKVIETVIEEEKVLRNLEIYLTLTNDENIHKINFEQRKVDRPTDVLSFPMFERDEIHFLKEKKNDEEESDILGDIIISVDTAKRQAEEYGHSFEREVSFLVVHSVLHLLGYDHERSIADEKKMFEKQDVIMKEINVLR